MEQPVHTVIPFGIALLLGTLHYVSRKRLIRRGSFPPVTEHLQEFARSWFLLAGLHLVILVLHISNLFQLIFIDPKALTGSLWAALFHMGALYVCAQTNIWLMRAVLHLRIPYALRSETHTLPTFDEAYWSILSSGILSICLLWFFYLTGRKLDSWELCLAYIPQMITSAGLFVWLGSVHIRLRFPLLALIMWAYALGQIAFPVFRFWRPSSDYPLALTLASVLVGLGTVIVVPREGERLDSKRERVAIPPIQAVAEHESHMIAARRFGQGIFFAYVLISATVLILTAYIHYQNALNLTLFVHCLLGVLVTALLWFIYQSTVYWVLIHHSPPIVWERHCDKLSAILREIRTVKHGSGWSREIHTGRNTTGKCVVFVHGFGGSGRRSWGLLPALLLECDKASSIHLLSYKHNLYTLRQRAIEDLSEELANILRSIVEESENSVVVIGHSLGGLLSIGAFDQIRAACQHEEVWADTHFHRLKHLICVASPIVGSPLAYLTFPFAWTCLGPMSNYIRSILLGLRTTFPPQHQDFNRRGYSPDCTILYGSRDTVISPLVRSMGFTQVRMVPGWHATYTGEVFSSESPQFSEYKDLLGKSPGIVGSLARAIWDAGGRQERNRGVVAYVDERGIGQGRIEAVVGDWQRSIDKGNMLMEALRRSFEGEDGDWESAKDKLERVFPRIKETREMLRLDWGHERTLVGWTNSEFVAIAVLHEPRIKELRGRLNQPVST